jgi:cobalt-zinc-cadmium efflux system outer membrane protein
MLVERRRRAPLRVGLYLLSTALLGCAADSFHPFDAAPPPPPVSEAPRPMISAAPPAPVAVVAPVTAQPSRFAELRSAAGSPALPATGPDPVTLVGHAEPVAPDEKPSELPAPRQDSMPAGPASPKPDGKPDETPLAPMPRTLGITFDQAINACLVADPKIRAGFEAINQANADALTASLKPNPTLFTDGQLLPLTRVFTVTAQGGPPQQDVILGYPIDWFLFGKRAAAMASAAQGVRQSQADYADLIRTRVLETASAFYDVVEAKGLVDVAQQDVANLTRVEAITRRAVEAGGRPIVDGHRVRLDLLKSEQTLRDAQATLAINKAKLKQRLGRTDGDPDFDVIADLDRPLTVAPLPVEEAYAQAQQERPDIQSLRLQVSKAQADVVVERRKAFPDFTPQFGYTRQYQTKAIGFPDADSWSASVTTSLPMFNRNQGNRAKSRSVAVQNSFNLETGLVDLREEIEQVVQEFRTAQRNAEAVAAEQLKLAAQVRDAINKAYEAGGRPLLDVLDAQRNYRETYRLYITSRASYWRSVYKFSAAIGKQVPQHGESTTSNEPRP